jgi:hypothetical protein
MKILKSPAQATTITLALLSLLLLLYSPHSCGAIGKVSEQTGVAEIQRNKQSLPSAVNSEIESMDVVVTAKGKLDITFNDNTKVSVGEQSKLVIDDFVYDAKKSTGKLGLKIALGTVRYASGQIAKHDPQNVGIQTPTATVAVRGTDFSTTVDEIGQSTFILLPSCDLSGCVTGAIEVSTDAGFVLLNQAFQSTTVSDKINSPSKPTIINIDPSNINNSLIVSSPVKPADTAVTVQQIKTGLDVNFLDQDFLTYKQLSINLLDVKTDLDKNKLDEKLLTNALDEPIDDISDMLPGYDEKTNLKYNTNGKALVLDKEATKNKFQLKVDKNADATLKLNQEGTALTQNINMGTTTKIDITQK